MIAISGKAGVGKTTLANILTRELGYPWLRTSFADPLKHECVDLFGIHPDELWKQEGKTMEIEVPAEELEHLGIHSVYPETLTVRRILQLRGQYCRSLDKDYWIKAFDSEYGQSDYIVIDDVRYPNELDYCKGRDAFTVRILTYPGWKSTAGTHESETALDHASGWDVVYKPSFGGMEAISKHLLADYRRRPSA